MLVPAAAASVTCHSMIEPPVRVRLAWVSVPGELPGERMAPAAMFVAPTMPEPCNEPARRLMALPRFALATSVPALTVTALVPKAPAEVRLSVPASSVVVPAKVEAPLSVKIPVPDLTRAPVPSMEPLIVRSELSPVVSEPLFRRIEPSFVRAVTVSAPLSLSVAPVATVTLPTAPRVVAVPVASVPALTTTSPEMVLAPERWSAAEPSLVRPATLTAPERVTSAAVVSVRAVPRVTVPERVRAPALLASPRVTSPATVKSLARATPVEPEAAKVPALRVTPAVPSAVAWPTCSVPALTVVPPV